MLALLLGLVLFLGSCSAPHSDSTAPSGSSSAGAAAAQATLDGIRVAVLHRDYAAYRQLCSTADPQFAVLADRLYSNLTALPLVRLALRLGPQLQELTAARRALLGPGAVSRPVAVTWEVTGDRGPAEHQLWLTFVAGDDTVQVAGTSDGPAERSAQPLWAQQAVDVRQSRHTTVLATGAQAATAWTARGDAAAAAVRQRLRANAGTGWNGNLVLEVPSTRQGFERTLGVTPGSYAAIAAVAWPEGPDAATAAIRIVVNPEIAAALDDLALAVLLTHEAVHVATRSAVSAAPTWVVEGFADYVAYDAHPQAAPAAAADLLASVREHGAPAALPSDAQFAPTAPGIALAYAEAWWACRLLAGQRSPSRLARFYHATSSGTNLTSALQATVQLTPAALTASWRRSLLSAARRS